MRVIIAVESGPPACDSVDGSAAVAEKNAASLRVRDGQRVRRRLHLRVGQPNMANAARKPLRRCAAHLLPPMIHDAASAAVGSGLPKPRAPTVVRSFPPAATWTDHGHP